MCVGAQTGSAHRRTDHDCKVAAGAGGAQRSLLAPRGQEDLPCHCLRQVCALHKRRALSSRQVFSVFLEPTVNPLVLSSLPYARPLILACCWIYLPACHECELRRVVAPCRLLGRGKVHFPLDGKPCLTEYQVLGHTRSAQHNWVTTVKLRPHTGAQDGWFPLSQEV